MSSFLRDNQELLKTIITAVSGIITAAISAYVSLKLGERRRSRQRGK